ncbi:hypothetical protein PsalMR5_01474 [Piscirickettsia salmonis]|uniref:hypothetical protein n=1 Tax=Piscirickettsia salmonis TaxID=1238 RepID=UPI0012BA6297|nr:hypothetical protein [Piscirickettsia salmonis]QGP54038.1 hypothetical protein PsalSR1_01466 [Piscirickettsia salmonis]QGP60065.1 hypothetical protein PsalBI1_02666 [Piscirickettsia salmonis]QGP63614.1 hypothetical protein PsalMR5_01474 [Piscirickettsia salmonis]
MTEGDIISESPPKENFLRADIDLKAFSSLVIMNKTNPIHSVTKEQLKAIQLSIQAGMKLNDVANKYRLNVDVIDSFVSPEGELRENGLRMMLNF